MVLNSYDIRAEARKLVIVKSLKRSGVDPAADWSSSSQEQKRGRRGERRRNTYKDVEQITAPEKYG